MIETAEEKPKLVVFEVWILSVINKALKHYYLSLAQSNGIVSKATAIKMAEVNMNEWLGMKLVCLCCGGHWRVCLLKDMDNKPIRAHTVMGMNTNTSWMAKLESTKCLYLCTRQK